MKQLAAIVAGQLLCLLVALSFFVCTKLLKEKCNFQAPFFQQTCGFSALFAVVTGLRCFLKHHTSWKKTPMPTATMIQTGRENEKPVKKKICWWQCALHAGLESMALWLLFRAVQLGDVVLVAFLGHLSIPFLTFLSTVFLQKCYAWTHFVGCAIAFLGCSLVVLQGVYQGDIKLTWSSNQFLACLHAILAAALFSCVLVLHEYLVRDRGLQGNLELIQKASAFAIVFAGLACMCLELHRLKAVDWSQSLFLVILCLFMVSFSIYVSCASVYIRTYGALLFRLSLMTRDVWILLSSFALFSVSSIPTVYYISVSLNMLGVVIYTWRPPTSRLCNNKHTNGTTPSDEGRQQHSSDSPFSSTLETCYIDRSL